MTGHVCKLPLLLIVCMFSSCFVGTATAQKVGSPEWKREFERKKAEFDRKFEATRAKMRQNGTSSSIRIQNSFTRKPASHKTNNGRARKPEKKEAPFTASRAPSPIASLKSLQKAANQSGSFKSLLPYFSEMQRSNYEAADKWGSKQDRLKFHRDLMNSIVRYDDVRIKGNTAYVDVVRKKGNYNTGTFTLKGEGNSWRMQAYKDKMTYNYLPAAKD